MKKTTTSSEIFIDPVCMMEVDSGKQNPFLAMVLCCGLPLVAIYAFSALGLQGFLGKWGIYALILLCPLAHIWMMRGMMHRDPEDAGDQRRIKEIEHNS